MRRFFLALVVATATPASALDLSFPVACTLGEDCYLQNLFDHDPGPGAQDAACGPLSYDGHDGTDIAVPTLADQARGVDVLAAAAGVVLATRDGVADALQGVPGTPEVVGRECGNGVLIRHADGWETQSCHMVQGSIAVVEGQEVSTGMVLGRVGYSGDAQFPHLHLTVRHHGVELDPFAPDATSVCGELPTDTLWADPLPFPEGGITDAGFATAVPSYDDVKAGTADRPSTPDQPLVLFGLLFGVRAGDVVHFAITGPSGEAVFDHAEPLDRTQALLFRAGGRRAPDEGWPAGPYEGTVTLRRGGEDVGRLSATVEMPG